MTSLGVFGASCIDARFVLSFPRSLSLALMHVLRRSGA